MPYQLSYQYWLWLLIFGGVFLWSAIGPKNHFIWALEVSPAVIGLGVLIVTHRSFPLTPLVYGLILLHCIILMIGGHYTYAEVPLFDDIARWMGSERNNFDKLGHFAQGFVPVMITREIVLRLKIIQKPFWIGFFSVCFSLAFSAFYELIEWVVAISTGESAEAFLGTQGYVWDTQTDMALALLGAISSLALLTRYHSKQLNNLTSRLTRTQ